jgi:hypothetical protein
LTAVILLLALVVVAACGNGDGEEATQPPGAASPVETSTGPSGATPTEAATPAPVGSEFSSSATASVKVGDKTSTFENGTCTKGPDDAWLGVSIGQVDSPDYFLLLVGNPGSLEGARSAKDGGEFMDGDIVIVTGAQNGAAFSLSLSEEDKVTVAEDLKSGEFVGTTTDGEPISGSFNC